MSTRIRTDGPTAVHFCRQDGSMVFEITASGELRAGPGLSDDEATKEMFGVMSRAWPGLFEGWMKARIV